MKKEIKQALIGKTISYYDGWCGSSNYFKIGYLKKDGSSIRVFPEKGKGWGVFIPHDLIPELIEKGHYDNFDSPEQCFQWWISNENAQQWLAKQKSMSLFDVCIK